jgi:aspartyl-tRNA(Asn)/glutamyl-tRNA(Gln) amidotransferase subunit A
MHDKTIAELSAALAAGEFTSLELTEAYLQRIRRLDDGLNSFITVAEEQARAAAREADAMRERGEAGPLTGVPLAFKDIFCTEDVRTSCGSLMLDNFAPPYDAHVVARFKAAGAVMLGKTNMDEFAMGSSNEASYYGAARNPWDRNAVPGGSSGGSAAAVAARLTPGATGTDTGGSIRQPAALCGISGLKPTYGRVSRYGMIAFASSLDQAGPMARTAEDLALMLEVMAGLDERDSTCADRPVPHYSESLGQSVEGLTIGLPKEFFGEGMDDGTREAVNEAVAEYERLGATVREVSLPNSHLAVPAYYVIAPAEASSNLSRFDGVRYGYRCAEPQGLEDMYKRSRGEGFGPEVKRRIMVGTYALSAGYYDAYYRKAQQVRRLIRDDFVNALGEVDLIMGPTAPTPAFDIGAKSEDPVQMYLSDIYTIAINLAGVPAVSIPAGESDGRPVGLQLVGDYFDEGRLLNAADQFQRSTDHHHRAPAGIE